MSAIKEHETHFILLERKLLEIVFIIKSLEEQMDTQIKKVKKDLAKGEKDTSKLLKMDKKFDKKLDKCDKMMKKKK